MYCIVGVLSYTVFKIQLKWYSTSVGVKSGVVRRSFFFSFLSLILFELNGISNGKRSLSRLSRGYLS